MEDIDDKTAGTYMALFGLRPIDFVRTAMVIKGTDAWDPSRPVEDQILQVAMAFTEGVMSQANATAMDFHDYEASQLHTWIVDQLMFTLRPPTPTQD